jgi:hypothetical protein
MESNNMVLSFEVVQMFNTEVVANIGLANKARITKDEFLIKASEGFAEVVNSIDESEFTHDWWIDSMAYIKAQIVEKFNLSPNTAKDYLTDIVELLEIRNPAIKKPASTKNDAVRKSDKKIANEKLLDEYKDVSIESLTDTLVELAPKTDKNSVESFKKTSEIIKLKNDKILADTKKQDKENTSKFKELYRTDFKDILNNEYEFAQYLHARLAKYRKEFQNSK